jgi:hypothetical protein
MLQFLGMILLSFFSTAATSHIPVVFSTPASVEVQGQLTQLIQNQFASEDLRQARVQMIEGSSPNPSSVVVRLFSSAYHRVENVKIELGNGERALSIQRNYQIPARPLRSAPKCPDMSVEFISFAPNDDSFEQGIAQDVADAATKGGLKTVLLLGQEATRVAYLNYMSCPNLKGNFYDGDSNPYEMITADDAITAQDFQGVLKGAFRFKVTNIWLACEAFNDPMLSSVKNTAQSQKYAAGINNLQVGPSDRAAACTMKAAINGQPMTSSFQKCYKQYDNSGDQWGFEGQGSDYFGQ